MTTTEAKDENCLMALNEIQSRVFEGHSLTADEMADWRLNALEIKMSGYVLHKRTVKNAWGRKTGVVWRAVPEGEVSTRRRHFCAEWVRFAPPADHRNECTTRGIFFVLGETEPYESIRAEQNLRSRNHFTRGTCYGWNHECVWGEVLEARGFVKLRLPKKTRRDVLASKLAGCGRILTHSSRHVAGILDGRVYDSWNSMHGRCDYLYCRVEMYDMVKEKLDR